MLKLSVILSVFTFLFSFVMNLDTPSQDEEASSLSFIDKATLSNRELSNNRSWFHVLMVAVITFATISTVQRTRELARQAYTMHNSW